MSVIRCQALEVPPDRMVNTVVNSDEF